MKLVYAKITAYYNQTVQVIEGEAWRADDPVVQARPTWFSDVPRVVRTTLPRHLQTESGVEQATAAPGEKRTTRRRSRKQAEAPPEPVADMPVEEAAPEGETGGE